ncbi:hypothetical protein SERLA73DRAFT_88900 [Serpula lacrymans var. lacrymans S7.3]|uniref:Very-long-chain (3R)-3-hydroxyacyl-CoA dehydratase n=2 Tax=Serpula lacrymans var. lacrymans TaxID=341189 RepID=F8PUY7_SERL3|nr:uncharacterized protein SERLADRAFT_466079 [Serpula lacrymans var. lacrymans S7.9]EGO00067.1 hypothetical protein SERLA73DRAFT_88900 [Serpula lacrymans var. lacrymans S7.3]EGO25631.1 hypothetical protein SERLADRAFT_466079 [Serpula lacrymans var. lacrymans S7.9]
MAITTPTVGKDMKEKRERSGPSPLLRIYLIAFNVLSALGWAYVFGLLVMHLFSPDPPTATKQAQSLISSVTAFFSSVPSLLSRNLPFLRTMAHAHTNTPSVYLADSLLYSIPKALHPRIRTACAATFRWVAPVQTLAVLEVVHALFGLVRSPLVTTGMQVASRLILVWGVAGVVESTHTNPFYTTMLFAWCLTEVPRYTFYALSLLPPSLVPSSTWPPYFLLYIRYTTFYVLYPLGAGSEAFIMLASVPDWAKQGWKLWTLGDWTRAILFFVWWPSLYVLYTHMMKQRRRILGAGKGQTLGAKPKAKVQ